MLLRPLLSACMPGGERARLSILIFHRVTPETDPLFPEEVDAARFEQVCRWAKAGFNVLPLPEAVERLYRLDLPERALAITFDDGYADNRTVAAPILQRLGLPCTFFIATGYLDGGCMWNDIIVSAIRHTRREQLDLRGLGLEDDAILHLNGNPGRRSIVDRLLRQSKYLPAEERQSFVTSLAQRAEVAVPTDLMMTSAQVCEMDQMGFTIGAHTETHPILARLDRAAAVREIGASKATLERMLGHAVGLFAYPNGKRGSDYSEEAVRLVCDAGFDAAVSTNPGVSTVQTDRFQLARFTPWDRSSWRFALRMSRNAMAGEQGAS